MFTKAVFFLAAGLFVADKDADRGPKALQGKWAVVSGEEGGKRQSADQLKDASVEITGNRIRLRSVQEDLTMTFTTRADAKPPQIDFAIASGKDKGKTSKGIYSLDGDSLRIAYTPPGGERPKGFTSKKGSHQMVWTLRRAGGGK